MTLIVIVTVFVDSLEGCPLSNELIFKVYVFEDDRGWNAFINLISPFLSLLYQELLKLDMLPSRFILPNE